MRLEEKDLMLLTVGDIMTKKVYTIDADESIRDAADLMSRKGIGCLVVTENEEEDGIAGILTESDILRRVVAVGAIPVGRGAAHVR
jgi:CBS domain-containing protein